MCQLHPSSGVHKTVTTASGTGHIFCAATSLQHGQASSALATSWPRWCSWHPKHVEWTCRIIHRLFCIASHWTIINISPLIFLECSQYPFTRKVYLFYCTRLLLATRFVLKVKSFPLSWRPTMKIWSIPYIYSLTLRCSILLFFFYEIKTLFFYRIHKKQ